MLFFCISIHANMDVELQESSFVAIKKFLLPYFKTWERNTGIETQQYGDTYLLQEDSFVKLDVSKWYWICFVYATHDARVRENSPDDDPLLVEIESAPGLQDFSLNECLSMIYVMHFYESPLISRVLIIDVVSRLRKLSTKELTTLLADDTQLLPPYCPVKYKKQIAFNYSKWRHTLKHILSYHMGNIEDIVNSIMAVVPKIGSLMTASSQHALVVTNKGVTRFGTIYGKNYQMSKDYDIKDVISVSSSPSHSFILTRNSLLAHIESGPGHMALGVDVERDDDGLSIYDGGYIEISPLPDITFVACGRGYSMFINNTGLFACGVNNNGQLGLDSRGEHVKPQKVNIVDDNYDDDKTIITSVACGRSHTLMLTGRGALFACGYNRYGQLGDNSTDDKGTPQRIMTHGITAMSCGANHSMFINDKGYLLACGLNMEGQLGTGTTVNSHTPSLIDIGSPVVSVSCNGDYSMILTESNSLFVCGANYYGQLGLNDDHRRLHPTRVDLMGVIGMSAGYISSIIMTGNGLYGCGSNEHGELGLLIGEQSNDITKNVTSPTKIDITLGHERVECNLKRKEVAETDGNDKKKLRTDQCLLCLKDAHFTHPVYKHVIFCGQQCYEKFTFSMPPCMTIKKFI